MLMLNYSFIQYEKSMKHSSTHLAS